MKGTMESDHKSGHYGDRPRNQASMSHPEAGLLLHQTPTQSQTLHFTVPDSVLNSIPDSVPGSVPDSIPDSVLESTELKEEKELRFPLQIDSLSRPCLSSTTQSTQLASTLGLTTPLGIGANKSRENSTPNTNQDLPNSQALPSPSQPPPDSSIADLWEEVHSYTITHVTGRSTMKYSPLNFAHALVNYNIPSTPLDRPDLEHFCKYLQVDGLSLSIRILSSELAINHAREWQQDEIATNENLMARFIVSCVPDPQIKTSESIWAHEPGGREDQQISTTPRSQGPEANAIQLQIQRRLLSQMVICRSLRMKENLGLRFGLLIRQSFKNIIPQCFFKDLKVPSWNIEEKTCAHFLDAVLEDGFYEWVKVASKTLYDLLTFRRVTDGESESPDAANLRQYSYLVSAAKVEIWEMSCGLLEPSVKDQATGEYGRSSEARAHPLHQPTSSQAASAKSKPKKTRSAIPSQGVHQNKARNCGNTSHPDTRSQHPIQFRPRFKICRVNTFDLTDPEDILQFDGYHQAIIAWGLRKYCLPYASNLGRITWQEKDNFVGFMSLQQARRYWEGVVDFE